jgi:inosine-uridine nucleoside N-ribohydrolase
MTSRISPISPIENETETIYVLDTDVGYDPDDLMAIWMFAKQFPNGHIITSAEVGVEGNGRARVVCRLLRDFPDVRIYAGSPGEGAGLAPDISDCSRFTGWAKTQFQCAQKRTYTQIVAACLLDETAEHDHRIKDFAALKEDVVASDRDIVWIGIGAMSNLKDLLSALGTRKINVVQMGVCSKNVKKYAPTNIFLDPAAAVYVNKYFQGDEIHDESSLIYVGSDFTSKVPWLHGSQLHKTGYGGWIQGGELAEEVGHMAKDSGCTAREAFKEVYGQMAKEPGCTAAVASISDTSVSTFEDVVFNGCREIWESEPILKECIIANVVSGTSLGGECFANHTFETTTKLYFDDSVEDVSIPKCGTCWPWDSNFHDILTVYIATRIYKDNEDPKTLGCQRTVINLRDRDGALEHWTLPDRQIFTSKLIPEV